MKTTSARFGPGFSRCLSPACVLLAACWSACTAEPDGLVSLPAADYEWFVAEVQPILARRCANSSCHGSLERPLQLYAERFHRLDPEATFLEIPLTEEELRWNFLRTSAFLMELERAEQSLLLLKPLAPEQGGAAHQGGTQFHFTEDYDYEVLYDWSADALLQEAP